MKWYRKAADQGSPQGQLSVGLLYAQGHGVARSEIEAMRWYELAAQKGEAQAQVNLGSCYWLGQGTAPDDKKAAMWFKRAAEQNFPAGHALLAAAYEEGRGVPKDTSMAAKLYRQAAEQGNMLAQRQLAIMLVNGNGVPRNFLEAVKWYRLAADQGDAKAQHGLGVCYYSGDGVAQSYEDAAKWYLMAAERGLAIAQMLMADLYVNARGVQRDLVAAYVWASLAMEELPPAERELTQRFRAQFMRNMPEGDIAAGEAEYRRQSRLARAATGEKKKRLEGLELLHRLRAKQIAEKKKGGLAKFKEQFSDDTYRQAVPLFKAALTRFAGEPDLLGMARALVAQLADAGMDIDAITAMKPYMRRFMSDVRSGKETLHAPSRSPILERDSGEPTAENGVGAGHVFPAPGHAGPGAGSRGEAPATGDEQSGSRERLPQDYAPVVGERGNLELPPRQPQPESGDAGDREHRRGDNDSEEGFSADDAGDEETSRNAQKEADLSARREWQKKAEGLKVVPGDISNIAETLPLLFPEQHGDVLKVEQRFAKPDGHGMMFTNGTGTGKTYSGLGVIKRFAMQGRRNTLVVAPSLGILLDWTRQAKNLGFELNILDSTQDKGKGFTGTTYANLGANRHLADREWDLVVADEAHKLSSAQDGTPTDALRTLRALTLHPDGLQERARMVLRRDVDAFDQQPDAKKPAAYAELQKKIDALVAKWREQERPKALMMSATPFPYHFSLDYAEGYLFNFDRGETGNSGNGRDDRP
jgi:TPR repeat protein